MGERPKLSVAIIAKDAEGTIGPTINSVLPVADQVVVVIDDRTTDRTEEAVRDAVLGEGGKAETNLAIEKRSWTHDFAAARNAALDLADGPWVMTMDADEDMDEGGVDAVLHSLTNTPEREGPDLYHSPLLVDPTYGTPSFFHDDFGPCGIVFRDRVFWKPSNPRWRFYVHENLWFPGDGYDQNLNVRFYHRGTMSPDKGDYYMALLTLTHVDYPEEPVPATMLAEGCIGLGDLTRAAKYLDEVDPELVKGLNGSKYWIAKGKCAWNGFLMSATGNAPGVSKEQAEALRDESVACYLKGHKLNLADHDGAILAASALFAAFKDRGDEAVRILEDVCRRDPHCIVSKRMLELWDQFGGPDGDQIVFGQRLAEYLANMNNIETDAALMAEGVSTDPAVANIERLDQILNAGGRQVRPKLTKEERRQAYKDKQAALRRDQAKEETDLKLGE